MKYSTKTDYKTRLVINAVAATYTVGELKRGSVVQQDLVNNFRLSRSYAKAIIRDAYHTKILSEFGAGNEEKILIH